MTDKAVEALAGRRVLVCGGRHYGYRLPGATLGTFQYIADSRRIELERSALKHVLDQLAPVTVIHGAAHGADELAQSWAKAAGVPETPFRANWYPRGRSGGLDRSAGPKRNQKMLDEGKPDLVVAFPGGKGTADMVCRAKAADIPVIEVDSIAPVSAAKANEDMK